MDRASPEALERCHPGSSGKRYNPVQSCGAPCTTLQTAGSLLYFLIFFLIQSQLHGLNASRLPIFDGSRSRNLGYRPWCLPLMDTRAGIHRQCIDLTSSTGLTVFLGIHIWMIFVCYITYDIVINIVFLNNC